MRLGTLLRFAFFILLLPLLLFGVAPTALVADGADAVRDRLRAGLHEAGRDIRFDDTARALTDLLEAAPRSTELSWRNIDRHMRTATTGYRKVRQVTRDGFMRALDSQPAKQLEKAADAVYEGVTDLSLDNMERAFRDPLPTLPGRWD
ncbi:MAG: hypothetical protein RIM84_10545 [Alphaproteobacteria bacterium]